ncbi:hypothetical protein PGTUg99_023902 [Puccinia graminis f. sp. tritici]|uniref:Uncharacterized protein n=1 Tax=Puccinia graminis f. sp. tritici TaxID=56615 RepID=A0A5B0SBS2_PUCGR|nr:hypothetical protein PGTUg99_023902 [Puccinia graminis f. sp. tritici]
MMDLRFRPAHPWVFCDTTLAEIKPIAHSSTSIVIIIFLSGTDPVGTRRGKFELLDTARRTVYLWSALWTIKNAAMTMWD